jgi:hypothetical protein
MIIEYGEKWQRVDLNRRPRAYELTSKKATSGLLSRPHAPFYSDYSRTVKET